MSAIERHGVTARYADAVIHNDVIHLVEVPSTGDADITVQTREVLASGRADEPPKVIVLTTLRRDEVVAQALASAHDSSRTRERGKGRLRRGLGDSRHMPVMVCCLAAQWIVARFLLCRPGQVPAAWCRGGACRRGAAIVRRGWYFPR